MCFIVGFGAGILLQDPLRIDAPAMLIRKRPVQHRLLPASLSDDPWIAQSPSGSTVTLRLKDCVQKGRA